MESTSKEDEKNSESQKNKLKWTEQVENIFINWADKAIVYKVLHERSYKKNRLKNYAFTIPCVCLSTILASATFALSGDSSVIPEEYMIYAQYGLGGVNIIIGILQTLQNFFKYAQMSEAHDSVSKQWYKLYRIINTELGIARNKRRDADEFMKYARLEFDRLIELSPDIPDEIIQIFKKETGQNINIKMDGDLQLPDICGTITKTSAYRFDDIEEVAQKEDPFNELVKKINENMSAASLYVNAGVGGDGARSRPQTPSPSTNSNNTDVVIQITDPINGNVAANNHI
jgi:hypothetical protein